MPSPINRRSLTKTIAVFLSWHEPRILKGIARFARENNWVILFDYAQNKGWAAIPKKVDGLLCLIGPERAAARYLLNLKLPMVALSNSDEGLLGKHLRMLLDDAACGRMAAEHLLSLGFENFLTVGKKNRTFFRERIRGFTDTIGQRAKVIEQAWIGESLDQASLRAPIEAAIRKLPKPLAIFSPSDVTCVHVMQCALELGLKVPEDVAILSANNDELICDFAPVPLSSIRLNFTQMGFEAAALLDRVMRGQGPKKDPPMIQPAGVISRQSTQIMLVPDEQVAKALRYIRHQLHRPLPIEEIADHVGVSHSTLARLFRKHLRRTIGDEIANSRLAKARELLGSGNLRVKEVAEACGYSTPNYFNHVFQRAIGTTPRKFRIASKGSYRS